MTLYQQWIEAKQDERAAQEKRRWIEDQLIHELNIQTKEGTDTLTLKDQGYKVKITQRFNKSIDSELLQEIAVEHGLMYHLSALFRWKPEVDAKAWKAADASITGPLQAAITTKPGRPSFTIETIEQE